VKVRETKLPGLLIIEPVVHGDRRGFFVETYSRDRYAAAGVPGEFVQDNLSSSRRGILRGLHLQHPRAQGKLCSALDGEVYDVAVDVRRGSPTFGAWEGVVLSSDNMRQLYVPPGFAHGFCVLSEQALFSYKCTDFYSPEDELGIAWDDDDIGIEWPIEAPLLSEKDLANPKLRQLASDRLPRHA
jgi:dTDP-4-dehydrorhamnose 3,5-epimerase